ncbi:MAG TPA: hypothetical protein VL326_36325 [Kofleriaceae bacterium]|jgi:hypothetical protein|nr:hypothetical protein [Kofleriaceae bacterium]
MAAGLDSFDEVRTLADAELQTLLESGRPEQRVWALWALALRSTHVNDIAEIGTRREPDAGVRRNLAVVLAGHGQVDLLVGLAKRDPAPEVRAAAMQLVSRLAIDGKISPLLVSERVATDATEVRVAVLGTAFENAPPWLVDIAERLLDDRDGEVRYEAFEAMIRVGRQLQAMMWLEEAPEAEARLSLMRWAARGRTRECALLLQGASRRLRRLLVESVRMASWRDLEPAIGDDITLVRAVARRNPNVFDEMPLAALMRATLREPTPAWIALIRDRFALLDHPPDEVAELLHDFRELLTKQIAECDAALQRMRAQRDDDLERGIDYLQEQRAVLEITYDHATRMVVH